MALFLQESQNQEAALSVNSLSEAFVALLEMSEEQGNLTEAMLTADYQIEKQQNAMLAEGKVEDAKNAVVGFAKRAGNATKDFAVRVWNRIKDIARLVARKVSEYVARLKGVAAGVTCTAPANLSDHVNSILRAGEVQLREIQTGAAGEKGEPAKIVALKGESKEFGLPVVSNLLASVAGLTKKLEDVATKMAGEAGRIEGSGGDATEVARLRAGATRGRAVAANITAGTSALGRVVGTAKSKKAGAPAIGAGPAAA